MTFQTVKTFSLLALKTLIYFDTVYAVSQNIRKAKVCLTNADVIISASYDVCKCKVAPVPKHHTRRLTGGIVVKLHTVLTMVLVEDKSSALYSSNFNPGGKNPMDGRLDGHDEEEKNPCLCQESHPCHPTCSLTGRS
jgi:hypothetical protein